MDLIRTTDKVLLKSNWTLVTASRADNGRVPACGCFTAEGCRDQTLLESALMALEKYLLELAKGGHDLRDLTRTLLQRSNNVAVSPSHSPGISRCLPRRPP